MTFESLLLTQVAIILAAASRNQFSGAFAFGMAIGFVIFMLLAGSMWFVGSDGGTELDIFRLE